MAHAAYLTITIPDPPFTPDGDNSPYGPPPPPPVFAVPATALFPLEDPPRPPPPHPPVFAVPG